MLEQTSQGFSIRHMLKKRFLDMVESIPAPKMGRVLVVDEAARTYLDACVEEKDLFLTEVSLYEQLELPRNGYPDVEVLYLITPTWASIERLVKDFTEGSKLHSGRLYAGAYLYFTTELGDDMYQYLTQSAAAPYIQNIIEYFVDFFAPEAQVFTTKTPHTISELYSPTPTKSRHRALKDMAKKIVSLNVALGENPIIKYFKPDGDLNTTEVSYDLAELVQEEFHSLQRGKQYLQTIDPRQPRATLVVLDRTVDLRAPLLHEVTYQAIVHDLLCLPEEATYTYKYVDVNGKEIDKEGELNEDDPVWVENRHVPFDQCVQNLVAKITKLGNKKLENNPDMSASAKLRQLRETLYSLPEYQDIKEKCSLHMTLSLECTELFTKLDIERLALLEQDLATGARENGEATKHMIDELVPILDDPSISPDNKLRILILYILSKDGLREETWQEINFHAQLDLNKKDNAAIRSLDRLGVKLNKNNKKAGTLCKRLKTFKEPSDFLMIARYVPMVKRIVENLIENTLPPEIFPTMTSNHHGGGPNGQASTTQTLRHMTPKWTKRKKGALGECITQKGRIIVFIIGGMTHSEMRSVYEISKELNREVIIGSSHILPPWGFLNSLRALQNPVDQSDILPSMRSLSIDSASSGQLRSRPSNGQTVQIPRSLVIPKSQSPAQSSPTTITAVTSTPPLTAFHDNVTSSPHTKDVTFHKELEVPTDPQPIYNSSTPAVDTALGPVGSITPLTPTTEGPANDMASSRNSIVSVINPDPTPKSNDFSEAISAIAPRSAKANVAPNLESPKCDASLDASFNSPFSPVSQPLNKDAYATSFPRSILPQTESMPTASDQNAISDGASVSTSLTTSPASIAINTPSSIQTNVTTSAELTRSNQPSRRLHRPRPRPHSTLLDSTSSRDNSVDSNPITPTETHNVLASGSNPLHIPEHAESYPSPSPSPSPPPLPVHPIRKNQLVYSSSSGVRGNQDQRRALENSGRPTHDATNSSEYRPPLPKKPTNYPSISSFTTTTSNPQAPHNSNIRPYPKSEPKPFPPSTQPFSQRSNPVTNDVNHSHNPACILQTRYNPAEGMPMPNLYMSHVAPLQTYATSPLGYTMDSPNTFPDSRLYIPNQSRTTTATTTTTSTSSHPAHNQAHLSVYPRQTAQPPLQMPTYTPYGRPLPKRPVSSRYHHLPQDDPIHQRYYR